MIILSNNRDRDAMNGIVSLVGPSENTLLPKDGKMCIGDFSRSGERRLSMEDNIPAGV